jgi:hypothetical protein
MLAGCEAEQDKINRLDVPNPEIASQQITSTHASTIRHHV